MIGRHKRLALAAVIAVVLVAVVATAALAQTPNPSATPGTQQHSQGVKYGQVFLDKLASALGIQRDQLDGAIKDASQQTADEAVKNGDMTQKQADALKNRIDQGESGFMGPFCQGGRMGDWYDGMRGFQAAIDLGTDVQQAITDKLGMTIDQLKTALKSGQSLADILKEKNVSEQDLRTAVVDTIKPKLDQAVQDGKLTQKQADTIISTIQNGKFPLNLGFAGKRGWHHEGKFDRTAPPTITSGSSS